MTYLVERVSRYAVVMRNEDRRSKPIMEALIQGLAPLPADARQSITFDRGTEFSAWKHLKAGIGADAWFCDPEAPYQKGTVENTNYGADGDDKSIFKVDFPTPQLYAAQMLGLSHAS